MTGSPQTRDLASMHLTRMGCCVLGMRIADTRLTKAV
jgi:hypothetical protein